MNGMPGRPRTVGCGSAAQTASFLLVSPTLTLSRSHTPYTALRLHLEHNFHGREPVCTEDHEARPGHPRVSPSSPYSCVLRDVIVHSLKLQRDEVRKYQKKVSSSTVYMARMPTQASKIQVVLDREHEIAKQQLAAGNKDRALIALRKRKYQEGLLVKTDAQLENLEKLVRIPPLT